MTAFQPFVMERMMSKWENSVDVNLSESGVHPLKLGELLAMAGLEPDALRDVEINYPQANGLPKLRETIAGLYPGAKADDVLVTVGAIEANYLALHTLVEPGDDILVMRPNYMQIWGAAKNRGVSVETFSLSEQDGWRLEIAELEARLTDKTKLIAVCHPNNPTGRILSAEEMDAIVTCAERVGAWLLADEVYRGAERVGDDECPTFHGRYDKVLVQGSMSKAYGLPGLRLGWSVGPAATLDDMWARHEYTTITATMLSEQLAQIALSPEVRPQILSRTRRFIREGYPVLEAWAARHSGMIEFTPPDAAAIAFGRYSADVNSTELVERLRSEKSVLIVPGDHFGYDRHLRVSFGLPHDYLNRGLDRIAELMTALSG